MLCELCKVNPMASEHHLIPKTCHKNKWFKKNYTREQMNETVDTCKGCHRAINKAFPDKEQKILGKKYYTKKLLRECPPVKSFIDWANKHPGVVPTK